MLQRLQEAYDLTPEQVEGHPDVREMVRDLVQDEGQRIDPDLRRLAQRVAVLPWLDQRVSKSQGLNHQGR